MTQSVLQSLNGALERFKTATSQTDASSGESARKKRRTSEMGLSVASTEQDAYLYASAFALSVGVASVVLAALPLRSLTEDVRQEVRQSIQALHAGLKATVKAGLKELLGDGQRDGWARQVVLAAALRLRYHLAAVPQLQIPASTEEKLASKMIKLLNSREVQPELLVEVVSPLSENTAYGNNH